MQTLRRPGGNTLAGTKRNGLFKVMSSLEESNKGLSDYKAAAAAAAATLFASEAMHPNQLTAGLYLATQNEYCRIIVLCRMVGHKAIVGAMQ